MGAVSLWFKFVDSCGCLPFKYVQIKVHTGNYAIALQYLFYSLFRQFWMVVLIAEVAQPRMFKLVCGVLCDCLSTVCVAQVSAWSENTSFQVLRIWSVPEHFLIVVSLYNKILRLGLEVIIVMVLIAANREIAWGKDWYLYVFGSLIGMVLLLAGKFSGGCIGMADGIIIALLGGMFGYPDTLLLLMYAILIAAGFSILLIVLKKAGRKTTIPFFPFLLLGYLLVFIRK